MTSVSEWTRSASELVADHQRCLNLAEHLALVYQRDVCGVTPVVLDALPQDVRSQMIDAATIAIHSLNSRWREVADDHAAAAATLHHDLTRIYTNDGPVNWARLAKRVIREYRRALTGESLGEDERARVSQAEGIE